jgi:hypothetical protein
MYVDLWGKEHRYGPPAGWVMPERECFSADDDWRRLVAQGLKFEPYSGPTRLCGVRGDCLEPLLVAGQHMLKVRPIAPGEPLIDGGLYCIKWDEADATLLPAYKAKWGIQSQERITIVKFLRFIGGEWRAQCKDSRCNISSRIRRPTPPRQKWCWAGIHRRRRISSRPMAMNHSVWNLLRDRSPMSNDATGNNGPYHLYDATTGLFVGQTFHTNDADPVAAAAFAKANTPEGHAVYVGHVGDHSSLKVDLATGELVDHQPPQPSADHEWNHQTKRWHQTWAAAAKAQACTAAIARIAQLEASQHRFVREHALGDPAALPKLKAIDDEIAKLSANL